MKIKIVHVSRRPQWPLWAVLIFCLWAGLGIVTVCLSAYLNRPVQLCLLKNLTGYPCPTCGLTRGSLSFLKGNIIQAWLYNPLLFSILGILAVLFLIRIVFAKSIKVTLTKSERLACWILAILLVLINWFYVIFYVG